MSKDLLHFQKWEASIQKIIRKSGACRLVPRDGRIRLSFDFGKEWHYDYQNEGAIFEVELCVSILEDLFEQGRDMLSFGVLYNNLANPAEPFLTYYSPKDKGVILYESTKTQSVVSLFLLNNNAFDSSES